MWSKSPRPRPRCFGLRRRSPLILDVVTRVHLPEWPITLVTSGIMLSILIVMFDSFRRGVLVMASSLVLAFFLRLVLNDLEAGMLKVRRRSVDLLVLGTFAAGLLILGFWVPAPS
jgi:predicted PurR-regulated permease PerM